MPIRSPALTKPASLSVAGVVFVVGHRERELDGIGDALLVHERNRCETLADEHHPPEREAGAPFEARNLGSDLTFLGFRFNGFGVAEPAIIDSQAARSLLGASDSVVD